MADTAPDDRCTARLSRDRKDRHRCLLTAGHEGAHRDIYDNTWTTTIYIDGKRTDA